MTARRLPAASEVQRLFDAKAETWPAKYAPDGPLAGRLASLLAAVSRYAPVGGRVLDLGCGTGELARNLAATGLQVTGCDVSEPMLARATGTAATQERGGATGWVRLHPDWRSLPFAPATFDIVVAASVLEYMVGPDVVLGECARVVRPGGVVLYTVPDLRHPVRWAEWLAQRLALLTGEPPDRDRRARIDRYRAYLRTSVQRHRIRWWLAVSAPVGLRPLRCPAGTGQPALRLLAFRRADQAGEAR
jgi:SAM-dependent methyltransferase